MRVTFVLWGGEIGGAEHFTADLARAMAARRAEPTFVFIHEAVSLADRLDRLEIPYSALGFRHGRAVLRAPRRFARLVSTGDPDVAILVSAGYLAAALRVGGYRGPIVGMEHGSLLQEHQLHPIKRLIRAGDRISGMKACSAVVAVSEYVNERVPWPGRRIVCIPNGVDIERFSPSATRNTRKDSAGEIVIGCAARLVDGKGVEDLIRAFSYRSVERARLRIAGDGPLRGSLNALARALQVDTRTEFLGPVLDMPEFWRSTDVAVAPSNGAVESFGMAVVEAMACAKPVVVSDSGALPYLVVDGETGRVVPAGDIAALAGVLSDYANEPAVRDRHGMAARMRCEREFAITQTASRYLELCADLVRETWPLKRQARSV